MDRNTDRHAECSNELQVDKIRSARSEVQLTVGIMHDQLSYFRAIQLSQFGKNLTESKLLVVLRT